MTIRALTVSLISVITIAILSGCQGATSVVSEEQAKIAVKMKHEQNSKHGEIKIVSIKHNQGEYEVQWERKSNCESGTDYVSEKDGKIVGGMYQIC
ncbi:hypothetical protein SD71_15045 [Cohnella kolymensis]|uniref:PepSY domain-containing protein n=1 Tax=Cohnella kolymensis TaxID=1590652 RepID=A0ABR5A1Q1_9BACL|nr:hypothetical protein [Cohnella kolymensis]KIL34997.1 hypothetical protein SD71_15045 [Cohnella kolymensis]